MDDFELMKLTAAGDQAAFATLVRRFQERLLKYCFRYLRDYAMSEDAVQEVFYRVYCYAPRYEPRASVAAFLYKIASNVCLDMIRIQKRDYERLPSISFDTLADMSSEPRSLDQVLASKAKRPEDELILEEALVELDDALAQIPARQRKALVLFEIEGLSYKDIAEILGASHSEVKIWIYRARKKLSKIMNKEPEGNGNENDGE